jgi:hypothetical protein
VPLLNHNKQSVAYTFLDMVFNRFRALVEILVDQGTKFHGNSNNSL